MASKKRILTAKLAIQATKQKELDDIEKGLIKRAKTNQDIASMKDIINGIRDINDFI